MKQKGKEWDEYTLYEVIACQDDFHLKAHLPQKTALQVNEGRRDINSKSSGIEEVAEAGSAAVFADTGRV